MKKITIPSKLSALLSRVDRVVSVGIALACIGTLIVSSVQFKNSLTDINSNIETLNTLPYRPLYVSEREAQTHSDEEIKAAWEKKNEETSNPTITQMSSETSMQPREPGILADLIVVGTHTGRKQYCYESFVADVRIDKVLSPLNSTSKLTSRGRKKTTYKIPSLTLHEGGIIKIYDELTFGTTRDGKREVTTCSFSSNPYTSCFAPLRTDEQYLLFLNYAPKDNTASTDTARFKIVPSLYGRIPISNGKTFSPNIFCANLPTTATIENSTVKPIGINSSEIVDEDFERRYQEAKARLPKFTYHDATKIDLFVKSPRVEQLYRDTAAKILQKYLGSA